MQVDEFERFVTEELTKDPLAPGIRIRFLKCDRDRQMDNSTMISVKGKWNVMPIFKPKPVLTPNSSALKAELFR